MNAITPIAAAPSGQYQVCTTLTRDTIQCDVIVHFDVTSFIKGAPQTWTDPADADEYEFAFIGATFDGEPDDAPGPITEAENAVLAAWLFGAGYDKACEAASSYASDHATLRADDDRYCWKDK